MLMLDPVRKHSCGHKNYIYALAWHVVGPGGKNTIEMIRILGVRDMEWPPEQ